MPDMNFNCNTLGYIKPVYYGQEQMGVLKGKPVTLAVTLMGMALSATHSPYGSTQLVVKFEASNKPLTHLLRVLENIITSVEEIFDGGEPTMKDMSGYHYRLIKAIGVNLNQFVKDQKEYSLEDVMQVITSLPPSMFSIDVTPAAH